MCLCSSLVIVCVCVRKRHHQSLSVLCCVVLLHFFVLCFCSIKMLEEKGHCFFFVYWLQALCLSLLPLAPYSSVHAEKKAGRFPKVYILTWTILKYNKVNCNLFWTVWKLTSNTSSIINIFQSQLMTAKSLERDRSIWLRAKYLATFQCKENICCKVIYVSGIAK